MPSLHDRSWPPNLFVRLRRLLTTVLQVHGLPNIELVLRPFAILTGCHSVSIELPSSLSGSVRIASFVSELEDSMKSKDGTLFLDDDLERKVESARDAMEEYVNYTLHGTKHHDVSKMTEDEVRELADWDDSDDNAPKGKKHGLSPYSKAHPNDTEWKKTRLEEWQPRIGNSWNRDFEILEESEAYAVDLEERQLQQAINASLGIPDSGARAGPWETDSEDGDQTEDEDARPSRRFTRPLLPEQGRRTTSRLISPITFGDERLSSTSTSIAPSMTPATGANATRVRSRRVVIDDDDLSDALASTARNANLHNQGQPAGSGLYSALASVVYDATASDTPARLPGSLERLRARQAPSGPRTIADMEMEPRASVSSSTFPRYGTSGITFTPYGTGYRSTPAITSEESDLIDLTEDSEEEQHAAVSEPHPVRAPAPRSIQAARTVLPRSTFSDPMRRLAAGHGADAEQGDVSVEEEEASNGTGTRLPSVPFTFTFKR